MALIKVYTLNANARALFRMMIPEPIPTTASHIAVDASGYGFFTQEEFRAAMGDELIVFPTMEIISYYLMEREE